MVIRERASDIPLAKPGDEIVSKGRRLTVVHWNPERRVYVCEAADGDVYGVHERNVEVYFTRWEAI